MHTIKPEMMESEWEWSPEEADQLHRSTKKMKRTGIGSSLGNAPTDEDEHVNVEMELPSNPDPSTTMAGEPLCAQTISYRDTLQRNNPNLNLDMRENPIWMKATYEELSDDDEPPLEDEPTCPTILLTAAEKRMLWER